VPADLGTVAGLVVLTGIAILLPGLNQTPLRIILGLPFVLFAPGYAFIAALFPEAPPAEETERMDVPQAKETPRDDRQQLALKYVQGGGSIDGVERVALSFGTSIAIVPLLGLALNFTPWGIRLLPVYLTVGGFTLIATAIATRRRAELPAEARFRVPYEQWVAATHTELFEPDTRTDLLLNILLVGSVLLAVTSVTYAVAVPTQGETFTEFYLLTQNETGDLVADDYPTEFEAGATKPIHVGIGNHEQQNMEYTVVVTLQRVQTTNNTTHVLEERELQRLDAAVPANETWHQRIELAPTLEGQRLRLAFLLYRDAPPTEPTVANAYRDLHLWVNVTAPNETQDYRIPEAVSPRQVAGG
jgi:uncharacterized membrane protein